MNQMKMKWMASILTILLFSLSGFTYATGPTPEENNSSSTNALKHINKLRQEMNLPEVVWSPALAKAADNHARYYDAQKEEMTQADHMLEQSGLAGFTGKTPLDRVQYAGYSTPADIHIAETLNVNVPNRSLAEYIGLVQKSILKKPCKRTGPFLFEVFVEKRLSQPQRIAIKAIRLIF